LQKQIKLKEQDYWYNIMLM